MKTIVVRHFTLKASISGFIDGSSCTHRAEVTLIWCFGDHVVKYDSERIEIIVESCGGLLPIGSKWKQPLWIGFVISNFQLFSNLFCLIYIFTKNLQLYVLVVVSDFYLASNFDFDPKKEGWKCSRGSYIWIGNKGSVTGLLEELFNFS